MALCIIVPSAAQITASRADAQAQVAQPDPIVRPETTLKIAPGVSIIPDHRVALVPNVGIVEGRTAVLVVDTGLGPQNGALIFAAARKIAAGRRIFVTTTHFHPEHAFGVSAFPRDSFIINESQEEELAQKGPAYAALFRKLGPTAASRLNGVQFVPPWQLYRGEKRIDLGGREVILRETPGHTRGDQTIFVPDAGVVFTGDLVENGYFPILFDQDSKGGGWISALGTLAALHPKIVVPGHGAVGGSTLIQIEADFLLHVQSEVDKLAKHGVTQDATIELLTPSLKAMHPDWDNSMLIPFAIAIFYGEARGLPPIMPKLPGMG